ncbi:hypothetical protein [Jannaschia donghaensis]|uniref:Uncharacterized protein n=1 Tax=Jannaschia donghaensis TaxID=420998 RepID=A0A0M6YCJ5_9RHOB|nr:hypothetical protein [Jannaschia donghaensis]CTQ48081.1 hypothetical protein JDO7802_00082 [Jannaschia donghaensis]
MTRTDLTSLACLTTALVLLGQGAAAQDGFAISVNGDTVAGDARVAEDVRALDAALAEADIQVSYRGLGADPKLDLEVTGAPGGPLTLLSQLNYPAYVTRGEIRIIDPLAVTGPRTIATLPVVPGGATGFVPPRPGLDAVLRVYDAQGRFDETFPVPLDGFDTAQDREPGVEDGFDTTARRRIPVHGASVIVTGDGVPAGASVTALGEVVAVDPSGGFVIERILPAGTHGIDVQVLGQTGGVEIVRDLEVPRAEWFYVATADVTFGIYDEEGTPSETFDSGRLAFYVEGRRADGTQIIASADSGEGDIADVFRRFDDRDPRDRLLRLDPRDLYPTYGDDSTLEDRTPTSGNLFLRVERDNNFLQWGDFAARLGDGTSLVRNDRTLYGLSAGYATQDQTGFGAPRASVYAYGAQPDQLPQRDVFLGTGGSVYFLNRQDISRATETISVQVRDGNSGRVIATRTLIAGDDYEINYVQGVVTLRSPLSGQAGGGIVSDGVAADDDVVLVVQYEYTPTLGSLDGFAYGGRAEGWVTDQLRVGVSGLSEETGTADQTLIGLDLLFRRSEDTFLRFDIAESDGPGFGSTFSADGGLLVDTEDGAMGTGTAIKLDGRAALRDLGLAADGALAFYVEDREEGFSGLDRQVTSSTGDELFWGLSGEIQATPGTRYAFIYDDYENDAGEYEREGTLEAEFAVTAATSVGVGLEHQDVRDSSEDGRRTDLAVRLTRQLAGDAAVYVFAQATLDEEGLGRNDRAGLGGTVAFRNGWSLTGEVSDGSLGFGAIALAEYADGAGSTRYAGWEVDPGREITGLTGRDAGVFKSGATERVSEEVSIFAEHIYDVFGDRTSTTTAYGLDWTPTERLSAALAIESGEVVDTRDNDFDRDAISVALRYATDAVQAQGRLEYRTDRGTRSGDDLRSETWLLATDAAWKIDESQRLVFSADYAETVGTESETLDGTFADVIVGYAFRPIDHDRLNVLARYRYLYDDIGQRVDGTDEERGPRQRSHVVSVDALYDINRFWTLGAKVGVRLAETASTAGDAFTDNDAVLGVLSARYHMVSKWDGLVEFRRLDLRQAETSDTGVLAALYRQINPNVSVGLGYNFGTFSDDLTDLTRDDQGLFVNLLAQF